MFDRSKDEKYVEWAKKVKERDKFQCQICGKENVYLHSHHLYSWDIWVNMRYDVENGVTLCYTCHGTFHKIYLKGSNTRAQFEQFKKSFSIIKKALKS